MHDGVPMAHDEVQECLQLLLPAECLVGGKYWRKMSPTNPFFCSRTFSCGHGDLLHVPGAADLIESEGRREVPVRVALRLQIGDLLLRGGNGIGTGDTF